MAEAMALGCPVIATASSGNLDFLDKDTDTALLVPCRPTRCRPTRCRPTRCRPTRCRPTPVPPDPVMTLTAAPYPTSTTWAEPDLAPSDVGLLHLAGA